MRRLLVVDAVGLTPRLLRRMPGLSSLVSPEAGGCAVPMKGVLPAVTCTAQSTMLTGELPSGHGAVANGWYFRDLSEVLFWRQSNALVGGEKVWEAARARDASFTCAKLFWWYNMYSSADWAVTVRPAYPADGRKLPDIHAIPYGLRDALQREIGTFPLFHFWGPAAGIHSTRWIVDCARHVDRERVPTLNLVYLPHLDYDLQRLGPDHPAIEHEVRALDDEVMRLVEDVRSRDASVEVVVLSEYGIHPVSRPVHLNRVLREAGYVSIFRQEPGEYLDAGACRAFAVADHQVAHVYVRDAADVDDVAALLAATPGVGEVLGAEGKRAAGLDHPRSGELVAVAEPGAWFTYYYWTDDALAPDFARTVDIHRKPGYDPVELFLDRELPAPRLRIARRLLAKKMGFRYLMDVIGLDASVVQGSHGRVVGAGDDPDDGPLFASTAAPSRGIGDIAMTDVKSILLDLIFESSPGSAGHEESAT